MVRHFQKRSKKNTRRKVYPKLSFEKRVLSVVNRTRELKVSKPLQAPLNQEVFGTINNGQNVSPGIFNVMPPIPQGDGEFNREGNQITLKKIRVNAYYETTFPVPDNLTSRALVRHMLVKQRNANSGSQVVDGSIPFNSNTILENAAPYLNAIQSWNTPINKSSFIVRRQMKRVLTANVADNVGNQTAGDLTKSYWMITYDITFGKGKKLNYRNGGVNEPADFPYFLMHSANPMGSNLPLSASGVIYNAVYTAYFYDS